MNKKYKCGWCSHEFVREVEYKSHTKHNAYSTVVVCPKCGRTIPTWEKELTGQLWGKKHTHDRR